ncbi:probable protease SohB, partial [Listeria monocytogenes FSL F2-208]
FIKKALTDIFVINCLTIKNCYSFQHNLQYTIKNKHLQAFFKYK